MIPAPTPEDHADAAGAEHSAAVEHRAAVEHSAAGARSATGVRAAFSGDEFSVKDAIGGPRGILESALPTVLFVVLFMVTRNVTIAGGSALAAVIVLLLARIIQRQPVTMVLGGMGAAVLSAVIAMRTGSGSNFYLVGILQNTAAALVVLGSALLGHPLVGYLAGALDPRVAQWRSMPAARRTYRSATLLLGGLFAVKAAVQGTLYRQDATDALGIAKLALGLPAFALVVFLIFLMHRALLSRLGLGDHRQ